MFALGNVISVETVNSNRKSSFVLKRSDFENKTEKQIEINVVTEDTLESNGTTITIEEVIPDFIDFDLVEIDLRNLFIDEEVIKVNYILPTINNHQVFMTRKKSELYSTVSGRFSIKLEPEIILINKSNLKIRDMVLKSFINFEPEIEKKIMDLVLNNLNDFEKIGEINFIFDHFFYPGNKKQRVFLNSSESDSLLTKEYLLYNSGVNIYRNGAKLFGYGKNDWLGLESSSRNNTLKASNNRTSAYIVLENRSQAILEEKTNREGLIESRSAFNNFKSLVLLFVEQLNFERNVLKKSFINNFVEDDSDNEIVKPGSSNEKVTVENTADIGSSKEVAETYDSVNNDSKKDLGLFEENEFIPKLIVQKKVQKFTKESVDLSDLIDLEKSIKSDGSKFKYSDITISSEGSGLVINGLNINPVDTPKKAIIYFSAEDGDKILQSFSEINFIKATAGQSREELFPLNEEGKHFKLESDDVNDFIKNYLTGLNEIWIHTNYDCFVSTSLRVIFEHQINKIRRLDFPVKNGKWDNRFKNFIEQFIDLMLSSDWKEKIFTITLGYAKGNDINNFISQIDSGESFAKKASKANLGSHTANATNPDNLKSIASNAVLFASITEAYLKVQKK